MWGLVRISNRDHDWMHKLDIYYRAVTITGNGLAFNKLGRSVAASKPLMWSTRNSTTSAPLVLAISICKIISGTVLAIRGTQIRHLSGGIACPGFFPSRSASVSISIFASFTWEHHKDYVKTPSINQLEGIFCKSIIYILHPQTVGCPQWQSSHLVDSTTQSRRLYSYTQAANHLNNKSPPSQHWGSQQYLIYHWRRLYLSSRVENKISDVHNQCIITTSKLRINFPLEIYVNKKAASTLSKLMAVLRTLSVSL